MHRGSIFHLASWGPLVLGLCLLLGLCAALGGLAQPAHAATTITVTICDESHLDAAIAQANSDNAGDTITFACSGDILLTSTLTITGSMTLDGSGQSVTLDGGASVQVLNVVSGGIANFGTVTVSNSTFANNSAPNGGGGGLLNFFTATISNSTFANNSAAIGGGIANFSPVSIVGSIVANNTSGTGNCQSSLIDQGYNVSSDGSCGFTGTGSLQNTDPKLDPGGLHNNGGPTQTIALLSGSPASDLIPAANCPATDQRGTTRLDAGETTCDSGAYEFKDPTDAPLTLTHFVAGPLEHRSAGVGATFTDADPGGQVSDYTATISWGDGTTTTVKIYKNPYGQGFVLAGVHTYTRTGTYTVTLTVTDKGGSHISKTVSIKVTDEGDGHVS